MPAYPWRPLPKAGGTAGWPESPGNGACGRWSNIAALAADRSGSEYLCDLGDQWLQPILIETRSSAFSAEWHAGFFPHREVQVASTADLLRVSYRRPDGAVGSQEYDLRPLSEEALQRACDHSQNLLRRPFCEILLPHPETGKTEHREYDHETSFWSLAGGRVEEEPCLSRAAWVDRISGRTGLSAGLITAAFVAYDSGT